MVENVGCCSGTHISRSTVEMVKTEGKERAYQRRFRHAQETNDVGCWQEENCRSAKAAMGEDQSEGRLERRPVSRTSKARLPILGGRVLCIRLLC
jgi:hypothetical protein